MPPLPPTPLRIGPYEIIAPLGAGGMGAVYRAWDPRLAREVAVKVLHHDVANDVRRQRRFLDEARAAGALSHPNILAVYDVGVHDGAPFIVSELIHGRRLRDELDIGPLPLKRLLDCAVQITAGLSAAHQAGIAHRDLKPTNIMIARDGRVKIVDFGLATGCAPWSAGVHSPGTAADTQTLTCGVLGTPEYMSPEQTVGLEGDFRSDQFSLGLMLYEMSTGVHPFRRETAVDTMSAIAAEEAPALGELNPRLPAPLRWLIERCLAKDPADRYASTDDLLKDLVTLQNRMGEIAQDAPRRRAPTPSPGPRRIALAAGVLLLVGATAAFMRSGLTSGGAVPAYVPLVADATFQGAPAWSPDGKTVAYVSQVDGVLQVFTRNLSSSLRQQVTDSRFDCTDPFWSRDGGRIFFHSLARDADSLWSISAAGGSPRLIVENASRATLSPDGGTLAFFREEVPSVPAPSVDRALWTAAADGTNQRRYEAPPFDSRRFVDGSLRFAPDGSKLLVWTWELSGQRLGAASPAFWMVPWPTGAPYEVLRSLADRARAAVDFDWLPDSRSVVVSLWDARGMVSHLWIADPERGTTRQLTVTPGSESRPAVAPDGTRVAFTSEAVDFDLLEIPVSGGAARTLLATSRSELDPAVAPHGGQYVYVTDRDGTLELWLRRAQDSWERPIVSAAHFPDDTWALGSPAVSPDGERVAYQRYGRESGYEVWISTLAAAGPPVRLAAGSAWYQDGPTWSPDGVWVAFVQKNADRTELARVRPGSGEPPIVVRDGLVVYSRPDWSPDGRWILCDTTEGLAIVSPDGRQSRVISEEQWIANTWASDGAHVYGLREADTPRRYMLAVVDIATGEERIINPDLGVIPPAYQPIRGLSRIGPRALATSVARARSEIWMLEQFAQRRTLLARFWPR